MKKDGTFETLSKKEKLQVDRKRAKLEKNLGSITDMTRLPGAIFVVDVKRENIAVKESQKLKIPIFAMVDTNSDPRDIDYPIPSNDDASKAIRKILTIIVDAIKKGLELRQNDKDAAAKSESKDSSDSSEIKSETSGLNENVESKNKDEEEKLNK